MFLHTLSPLFTAQTHCRPAVAVTSVAAFTFLEELQGLLFSLRWALLFVVVLVITDLWSGITAQVRVRGTEFRRSRAIRRTLGKFMEYFCFILIAALLSKAILQPYGIGTEYTGGAIGATIVLLVEADSIVENVCLIHGFKARFSVLRALLGVLRLRNQAAARAIEEGLSQPTPPGESGNAPAETAETPKNDKPEKKDAPDP